MKIWFTSDNHYGHKNISKFCPKTRPDTDVDKMNNNMIHRWNEQVAPDDTVWALGDFFFCNAQDAKNILRRLNGKINLVYGNHDKVIRSDAEIQRMFESIHEYKEIRYNGVDLMMFHYPIQEWNKMHHGSVHLYGHIHGAVSPAGGRCVNVCIDSPDLQTSIPYSLYSFDEVMRFADKKEVRHHHDKVIL